MSNLNKSKKKERLTLTIITGIVVPVFCVLLTHFLTTISNQADSVASLSKYFDVVDENMEFEQALRVMRDSLDNLESENSQLKEYNIDLEKKLVNIPNIEFRSADIIYDGLKIQESVKNATIVIDNKIYYSEHAINQILQDKFTYNLDENILAYNSNNKNITSETKIDLFDTGVLYDGTCYGTFLPEDGNSFSMGSKTYNKGFVIYDDHSLFGEGDGYVLFDLRGEYSKITFDVGRTNEYEKQDVVLKVYLDNEYVEEYSLNAQSPPVNLEINLEYAKNMKLEITGGSRVKYGFANVILHY